MLESNLRVIIQNPRLIDEAYSGMNQEEQEKFCCDVLDALFACPDWPNYVSTDLVYVDTGNLASSLFFDKLFSPFRKSGVSVLAARKFLWNILLSVQKNLNEFQKNQPDSDESRQHVVDIQFRMKVAFSGGLTPAQFSNREKMLSRHFSYEFCEKYGINRQLQNICDKCEQLGVDPADYFNGKYDTKPDVVSDPAERLILVFQED